MFRILASIVCSVSISMTIFAEEPHVQIWTMRDGTTTKPVSIYGVGSSNVRFRDAQFKEFYNIPIAKLSAESKTLVDAWKNANKRPVQTLLPIPAITIGQKTEGAPMVILNKEISVKKLTSPNVDLIPYGRLSTDDKDTEWHVISSNPPAFASSSENSSTMMVLTVIRASRDIVDQTNITTAVYENVLKRLGDTVDDSTLKQKKEHVAYATKNISPTFYLDGSQSDGSPVNVGTMIRFDKDFTFIFQAFTEDFFSTADQITKFQAFRRSNDQVPEQVVKEVSKQIAEWTSLARGKDTSRLLKEIMPPEAIERFSANADTWTQLVRMFEETEKPLLLKSLEAVNWDEAEYLPGDGVVTFPVSPRAISLKNSNGKWTMK